MKNYIFIGIVFVIVIVVGYFIYQNVSNSPPATNIQPEQQTGSQLSEQQPEDNTIYSVQELLNSELPEGQYVKVRGIVGSCVALKVSANYEGPGTGCYLISSDGKQSIHIGDFKFLEYKDQEIIVGGYVYYCGGKKSSEYICGIKNVEVLEVIQ